MYGQNGLHDVRTDLKSREVLLPITRFIVYTNTTSTVHDWKLFRCITGHVLPRVLHRIAEVAQTNEDSQLQIMSMIEETWSLLNRSSNHIIRAKHNLGLSALRHGIQTQTSMEASLVCRPALYTGIKLKELWNWAGLSGNIVSIKAYLHKPLYVHGRGKRKFRHRSPCHKLC